MVVSSDVQIVPSSTLTTDSPLPPDPWDAPYFGGPVYFAYRPAPMPMSMAAPVSAAVRQVADPWDAPYFGGPVYFRYSDYPVGGAPLTLDTSVETATSAESAPDIAAMEMMEILVSAPAISDVGALPAAPAATPAPSAGRKSWLARLFGR